MATSLRLLLSSTSLIISPLKAKPSFYFSILSKPKTLRHFTALARSPQRPGSGKRRTNTTRARINSNAHLGERKDGAFAEKKEDAMEESEPFGFIRKRAEGKDGSNRKKKTLKLRESRSRNTTNSMSYVQILGTGMDTHDTLPSVLLFFDKQRFIFNAGEGLDRFCIEHKIKLSKIDHIFLSRVSSETTGGFPGLFLALASMGDEGMAVNLWGTSDLKYLVNAMSSFIPNAAMVHTRCFGPSPSSDAVPNPIRTSEPIVLIEDEVVKMSAVLLQPKFLDEEAVSGSSLEKDLKERMHHFSQTNASNKKSLSAVKPGDMSVIYVCELPEVKGTFHPERAMALGLIPGPKYQELQLGNSVESDHKNIMVHPSDVMDPSLPGPIIFLVDCPTESHVQELLHIESLNGYYEDFPGNPTEGANSVACIIHLSPTSIVSSPGYQTWMKRFGSAQHIMAGHETKNVEIPVLNLSARIAARLNYLCPQFFPFPGSWSHALLNYSEPSSTASSEDPVSTLHESVAAENLLKFTLRPYARLGLDRSCVPSLKTPPEIVNELLTEIPEVEDAAREVGQFWNDAGSRKEQMTSMKHNEGVIKEPWLNESTLPCCLENVRKDDLEITFLGTGSSKPSKYRNVTSIYINLFSNGGVLLDCGEGTLGQLRRRYGVKEADEIVRALRCIWISHIHADHHTGITRLLALRRELLNGVPHEPLIVVGPRPLWRFLKGYQFLQDLDMQFLDCKHTTAASLDAFEAGTESNKDDSSPGGLDSTLFAEGAPMQSYWKRPGSPVDNGMTVSILKSLKKVLADAGIEELVSFPVVHCPQAYGVVLKATERINSVGKVIPGWKVAYSGDTRPCPALIEAARDATLLIHEATFEDSMMDEAVARNHSTTKEAIEVGASAGAYRVILTHFSKRYPMIPVLEEHMHRTCVAFDMMSVNIADLHVIPRLLPYIKLLFKNEVTVDESDEEGASAAS